MPSTGIRTARAGRTSASTTGTVSRPPGSPRTRSSPAPGSTRRSTSAAGARCVDHRRPDRRRQRRPVRAVPRRSRSAAATADSAGRPDRADRDPGRQPDHPWLDRSVIRRREPDHRLPDLSGDHVRQRDAADDRRARDGIRRHGRHERNDLLLPGDGAQCRRRGRTLGRDLEPAATAPANRLPRCPGRLARQLRCSTATSWPTGTGTGDQASLPAGVSVQRRAGRALQLGGADDRRPSAPEPDRDRAPGSDLV